MMFPRLVAATALLCFAAFAAPVHAAGSMSLGYLGQQIVPSGTQYSGTTVGGLSGIDFDLASGHFFAISDDRSALNPARFYELSLDLAKFQRSATPGMAGVNFNAVTTIQKPAAVPSPPTPSTRKACA